MHNIALSTRVRKRMERFAKTTSVVTVSSSFGGRLSTCDGYVLRRVVCTSSQDRGIRGGRALSNSYLEVYGSQVLDSVLPPLAIWA